MPASHARSLRTVAVEENAERGMMIDERVKLPENQISIRSIC